MGKIKYCEWCGRKTKTEEVVVAETPILEFLEYKIDQYDRKKIWGIHSTLHEHEVDPQFEAELLIYDELLSTLSSKTICDVCLNDNDRLWDKFYENDDYNNNFDSGNHLDN
jgi:hypothetical protein